MRAALIVRDAEGQLLDPQPTSPIPVDIDSVQAEVRRLRRHFGRRISIDSVQILSARVEFAEREARLTA